MPAVACIFLWNSIYLSSLYMHLSLAVIPAKNGLLTTEAVDAVPEEQYMPQQVCNTQDKSVTLEVRP
jgi:hypothetical protein